MFKKILVPVDIDYPKAAVAVYKQAAEIGKSGGAEIKLVSVMPGFGMPIVASHISKNVKKELMERFKETLEKFIQDNCAEPISYTVRSGKNWEEIIKVADKWEADLIVVFHNRDHEHTEAFSRSCSQRVADNAGCSVLWLRNIEA
jgi:nucleotide-binding universal stress UspA family protein